MTGASHEPTSSSSSSFSSSVVSFVFEDEDEQEDEQEDDLVPGPNALKKAVEGFPCGKYPPPTRLQTS